MTSSAQATVPKRKTWDLSISETGSSTREEIYQAVGHALTMWERLDTQLALSFGHFVGTRHVVALRALGRIESPAARLQVILEAFRSSSDEEQKRFDGFDPLIRETIKATEVRNAIAHGCVQGIEITGKPVVFFLAPTFSTTRKVTHLERLNGERLLNTDQESVVLGEFVNYALSATDIDRFRQEFKRIHDAVEAFEFPSAKMSAPMTTSARGLS